MSNNGNATASDEKSNSSVAIPIRDAVRTSRSAVRRRSPNTAALLSKRAATERPMK